MQRESNTAALESQEGAAAQCRFCGTPLSETFADLGVSPPSNAYLGVEVLRTRASPVQHANDLRDVAHHDLERRLQIEPGKCGA